MRVVKSNLVYVNLLFFFDFSANLSLAPASSQKLSDALSKAKGFSYLQKISSEKSTWQELRVQGAECSLFRVDNIPTPSCAKGIREYFKNFGKMGTSVVPFDFKDGLKAWLPWSEEDLSDIHDCAQTPCKVKLGPEENLALNTVQGPARLKYFLDLIEKRSMRYLESQILQVYEFPGLPVDPWETFKSHGLKSGLKIPKEPRLFARKLDLGTNRLRVLRQIIDSRLTWREDHLEATLWLRALYTDHYFDSWGEWIWGQCDPVQPQLTLYHVIFGELDLLKAKDLLSILMRGRLKSAFEEGATKYIENHLLEHGKMN